MQLDTGFDLDKLTQAFGLGGPNGGGALDALQSAFPGLQGLDPQGLLSGAEGQLGQLAEGVGESQSPDSAQLMALLQELIQLLTMLLEQGGAPGQEGAPGGGEAPAGGGGAHGGGGAAPAGGGGGGGGAEAAGTENVDGPGGFLWKPVSESDGNLVVLLPENLKGNVDSVRVEGPNGETLATGRFSGDDKNGGRPHFRFDKPGAAFGNGARVVANTSDGREVSWNISRGAARND